MGYSFFKFQFYSILDFKKHAYPHLNTLGPVKLLRSNSSFAPPNYSTILYNFEWIDNCYAKISAGAIFAKP